MSLATVISVWCAADRSPCRTPSLCTSSPPAGWGGTGYCNPTPSKTGPTGSSVSARSQHYVHRDRRSAARVQHVLRQCRPLLGVARQIAPRRARRDGRAAARRRRDALLRVPGTADRVAGRRILRGRRPHRHPPRSICSQRRVPQCAQLAPARRGNLRRGRLQSLLTGWAASSDVSRGSLRGSCRRRRPTRTRTPPRRSPSKTAAAASSRARSSGAAGSSSISPRSGALCSLGARRG